MDFSILVYWFCIQPAKIMKCYNPRFLNGLEEDVLKVGGTTAKTEFVVLCGCNARDR